MWTMDNYSGQEQVHALCVRMSTVLLSEMRDMVRTTEVSLYLRAAVAFEGHHAEKTWCTSVTCRGHSERSCLVARHGAWEERC